MDLLSLPLEKGLGSQLLGRNDVCNLKGGFIKGGQYAWLNQGPQLYFISTAEGTQVDLCTFASMPAADPEVELTTEVNCLVELAPREGRNAHQLIVGLNHNNRTGMVCIFDTRISRIVRAVHMPSPVTSLSVVDHGLSDRDSRQVLQQILREMDGILAVGLSGGEVFLLDLRRCDYERATSHSRCRDEFDVCYPLHVLPNNSRLGNEERLRRQEGDHMCVFINNMYLRETGMLVDKTAQTGCELISHDVSVSCLQYVPLVVGLVVGYDEGFFQLWNMRTLKLEFSSYVRNRRMGSVSHVVFQEPNDDPHPVCYLWTTHEDATQHAAVLYSLVYGMWDCIGSHGYVYKKFVSAMELSVCDTDLKPDARARFLDCYCLERMKETVRVQGQEEADLSMAVFVWEQQRGGCVTTHAHLFDMNEWLKEHHCPEENRMQRSHVTFPVPAGALAVSVQPESLRHFSTLQRLDKHLSPFALSFHWLALMPCSVEKGWCEGVQKKLVMEILGRGPTCLVDSDLVMRCMNASLQPTIGCDEPPQTEVERKKFLLNLMLEYCYSPDVFFGSSDNASDFRLLSLLHVWGWERAQVLKDNIDQLSVRLFDSTGVRVDEMWHSELRHCGTQLLTLYMVFSQLEKLAGESLSKVWEHKEGIMLMHVYYVVLQWFVTKGLLPESVNHGGAIPYPIVEIKHFYMARRRELAARDERLFIDQFLEHECEEEDLLRLGLVNGVYPPHSLQCLVKMYLLSEIPLNVKNILTTYVFKDVIAHLDENRRRCAVQELKDFASKLQLADSVVQLAESLWLFDHESFQEGVSVLMDNNVSPADVMPWLHTNIVNMLVSQHQFSSALTFMKWNKMASKNKEDARLYLMVCLAEKNFDAAFQFVHEFCREGTWRDVLQHFFTYCERAGLLKKVMHQPLSDYEEQEFLNYLRRSSSPDSEDIRVLYFTMRGRVEQGLAENDRINQERLHRPRRRRLQCDEMVPLRQLMANIYCKVLPKDWRREEDQKMSLALPIMEKTIFDATLHEKSSAGGSSKRPRLSREVRSTLHSLYVGSPGFPHISTTQSTTTTPQGILKVRSYPSTRDTSVETLITASSMSNLLDIPESEPVTPAKRIQFRMSSDSMEKMECDQDADVEEDESEVVSLLGKEQKLLDSVKPLGVFNNEVITNKHDIVARQSTSDEGESDSEVDLPANLQNPEMINEVQQSIRESSPKMRDEVQLTSRESSPEMIDEVQRASRESSASDTIPCDKSTTARSTNATFKRSTTASPLLVTDITRFNRRGIGPRRPLPAANREAASKMFVSSVTKKTRTTESSMSMAEKVEFSNSSFGRRHLNFDTDDSPKHSKIIDEQTSSLDNEKIITVEVESKVQFDSDSAMNERGSMSAVDTSEESCILSIDISDDTFCDVSKLADLSQCDNITNLVEQNDAVSYSQVEDIAVSEKTAADWHKNIAYCTPNSIHLSDNPSLVHPSNLEQIVDISKTHREPSIDASLKNEQRKDSLTLSDKSLEPSREDVCINFTAADVKTSTSVSKMGKEGMPNNLEQDMPVQALVKVVVPDENVEGSGFDDISKQARVVDELSEVVHESQVALREKANAASEGTAFSCTNIAKLPPYESTPPNVSETSPSLTTSTEEEVQALQLISKRKDTDENLNSNKSDVLLTKLLNVIDEGADSVEIEVSDVLQTEPIRIERIPFGLSPELLSKESFSSSVREGVLQVTESSNDVTKRDQTMYDSLSEMSHDVHSVVVNEHRTETSETAKASPVPAERIDDIKKAVEVGFADKQDEIKPSDETDVQLNFHREAIEHENVKSINDSMLFRQVPLDSSNKEFSVMVHETVMQVADHEERIVNVNQLSCHDSSRMSHVLPSATAQEETVEICETPDASSMADITEPVATSSADTQDAIKPSAKTDTSRQVSQQLLSEKSVSSTHESVVKVTKPFEGSANVNQTIFGDSSEISIVVTHSITTQKHTVETSETPDASSMSDITEPVPVSSADTQDAIKLSEETDTSANDITLRQDSQEVLSEKFVISLVPENALQIRIEGSTNGNQTTCDSSDVFHDVPHNTTQQEHTTEISEAAGAVDCLKEAVVVSFIDKQDVSNVLEEACTSTDVDIELAICKNEKLVNDDGSLKQVSQEVPSKTSPVSWVQEDVMQVTDSIEDNADGNQTTVGDSSEVSCDIHINPIREHTVKASKVAVTASRVDGVKEAVVVHATNKQDTNKPLETNLSSSFDSEGIRYEKEQSENSDSSTACLEGAERETKSIQNVSSKISGQCLPSYVEKGHVSHISETDVSICNEGNEKDDIKVMNIFESSVKMVEYSGGNIVQGDEVSVPVAAVVCPDGVEVNMSATSSGKDLSQLEVAPSRSVCEDTVQNMEEDVVASVVQTETSEAGKNGNPTSSDDVLLNILVQGYTQKEHAPVDSVKESERPSVQLGHTDGIENGKRERHTVSSNLLDLHASDLPCIATQVVTAPVVETADISYLPSTENYENKINVVSSLPLIPKPKEGLLGSGTRIGASQSASDEACVTSTVPAHITETKDGVPESSRVKSTEMTTLCLSNNAKEDSVILSVTSDLSAPGHPVSTDNKEENQTAETISEVLQQDVWSTDSPYNTLSESQKVIVSSSNLKETNSEMSEISAIADDAVHSGNNELTVPTRGVLELRTRSVEKYSLDDTDLPRNIKMKRKHKVLEPPTGMLKRRRSMSVLSLDLGVLQEASTPPRRQRRASLSCSGELRYGTPPPRRSLRLSGAASGIEGGPSMRLTAREKRKGRVSKKQLQTVYEDMELTTEAARKKLEAEGSYPDTGLSSPFMMPRRFTRSQLRMMKQNVRLEEMCSLGTKSPSFVGQLSAEDDASDEDDGRPPSICGSEVSSLVTVSGDQSECGHRSPRVRRRSYNLRSHASQSPVSEVSHTQSTSSHDDMSSVVSGMSEYHQKDVELGSAHKEGSGRPRKTRSSRLSLHLPEELSSPTDSLQSQVTEDERNIKTREIRRSPRRPYTSDSHDQTSTTSFSDAGPSPAAKDDDVSSTSSSDHHILLPHAVTRQKRDKRRQTRQVSSTANPTKKTKVSVEESTTSPRSSHSRQRYSRSAVHGRKSVRVRSSTSATAKSKGT